jgi:hypothetical protein
MSDALFEKYVRGEMSDGEREEMIRLLGTEAGARAFGDFIREWSLMADVSRQVAPTIPLMSTRPAPPRVGTRWLAAAAALIVGIVAFREIQRASPPAEPAQPAPTVAGAAREPSTAAPDEEAVAAARASLARRNALPAPDMPVPEDPFSGTSLPGAAAGPGPDPFGAPETEPVTAAEPPPAIPAPPPGPPPAGEPVVTSRTPAPGTPTSESTLPGIAKLELVQGAVRVLTASGASEPARPGQILLAGQGIATAAKDARAVVVFPDTTRLEVAPDTVLHRLTDERTLPSPEAPASKGAFLERGVLSASVAAQPAGRPLVLVTPHAEARVLGTRLTLFVSHAATRLDVDQGRVRFTRRQNGATVDLAAGQYAATDPMGASILRLREQAKRPEVARLVDDFEGALRWYHTDGSAPMDFILSPELFHTPRLSLLLSFRPPDGEPDARGTLVHPMRLRPTDRYLRLHVRVAELSGKPEWSMSLREKDDDHWHIGSGSFEPLRAAKGWNLIEVALPDGSPEFEHHGDGRRRFDPASIESLSFSVGGGRAVFFLDTILAVEASGKEVAFPAKPGK